MIFMVSNLLIIKILPLREKTKDMKPIIILFTGLLCTTLLFTSCAKDDLKTLEQEDLYSLRSTKPTSDGVTTERDSNKTKAENRIMQSTGIDPDKDEKDDDDDDYAVQTMTRSKNQRLPGYQMEK